MKHVRPGEEEKVVDPRIEVLLREPGLGVVGVGKRVTVVEKSPADEQKKRHRIEHNQRQETPDLP